MVKLANNRALSRYVGYECHRGEECGIELLFLLAVGANCRDEGARAEKSVEQQRPVRRSAGHDDRARAGGCS